MATDWDGASELGLVDTQDYSPCVSDPSLLDLGSPHSHLHRSQHSLRLRIYFKPAASLHNGKQVPRLAQCVSSAQGG